MTMQKQYETDRRQIEAALAACFQQKAPYAGLLEAMRYSLLAGGKRLRPVLTLETCRACGGEAEAAMPAACAVEMLHTYSLIHDDLPSMDNDTLRRGRPTCHIAYGECAATLAGDALQAEAFSVLLSSALPAAMRAECARLLAEAAGTRGICGGQYLDTVERETLDSAQAYLQMYQLKTSALFRAACCMGAVCAGASAEQTDAAGRYADLLGLAFQIRDDVLDATATSQTLGKDAGSDARCGKDTFLTHYGLQASAERIGELTAQAVAAAQCLPQPQFLIALAEELTARRA